MTPVVPSVVIRPPCILHWLIAFVTFAVQTGARIKSFYVSTVYIIPTALQMLRITSVYGIGHAEEQNARFRKTMEDATVMIDKFGNNPNLGYFAVFDGHGGPEASKTAAESVHKIIMENILNHNLDNAEIDLSGSLRTPKLTNDSQIDIDNLKDYEAIFRKSIEEADQYMKNRGHIYVGCTACICFVSKQYFTLINIGDSRAVMSNKGVAQRLTNDHKAAEKSEQERIK